jgi:hypothetical protein
VPDHIHHHDAKTRPQGEPVPLHERSSALLVELRDHLPFSVSAVAIGLIVAGTMCILVSGFVEEGVAEAVHDHAGCDEAHDHGPPFAQLFFHLFHPAHMLFSAAATTAMFRRYDRKIAKAIIVGIVGAIGVCGVSDIIMPHISLSILGVETPWHICVVEHPGLVLPYAGIGVLVGLLASGGVVRSTVISHSLHVLASSMASIFYMVGPLGIVAWIDRAGEVFLFVVLAVMLPCCVSDIVFPLLMTRAGRAQYVEEPHPCH